MHKKIISSCLFYFMLVMIVLPFYPDKVSAEEPLSVSGLAIETKSFRPYREKGKFSFFLNRASQITAEIQDSDFNLVRTLALMIPGSSGKNELEWDGKDEKGNFINDGKYILSLSVITDDGASSLISKKVIIDFDAPNGMEYKTRISNIEGKTKKQHISTSRAPNKIGLGSSCLPAVGSCIFGVGLVALAPILINSGANKNNEDTKRNEEEDVPEDDRKVSGNLDIIGGCLGGAGGLYLLYKAFGYLFTAKKDISSENTEKSGHVFYYQTDHEKFAEMNQEIDEYNAEIDAEITEKNKEIDEFNEKVKDTVIITMELVD